MMMPRTYKITTEQMAEIREARKENKDKSVDKRLRAIELRGEGVRNNEIAVIVETHPKVVSRWISSYVQNGLKSVLKGNCGGNRRNMSLEEETKFVAEFKVKAEKGQIVTVKEIKVAYNAKIGHKCGNGQIYRVLERQEWRKVVPRKEHPNKASEAEINASKKLTFG
jgi:transposase